MKIIIEKETKNYSYRVIQEEESKLFVIQCISKVGDVFYKSQILMQKGYKTLKGAKNHFNKIGNNKNQ